MKKSIISYRPDIDGLRAIAVISVIIFHICSSILPGGFVGVDVFFVISGFLITKIILKQQSLNQFSFKKFYIRRIRRIFPALFAMLFVSYIAAFLILTSGDMVWFARSFYYSCLQISNLFFQRTVSYFDEDKEVQPLLHTWSLGVEEQFYLLMPILVIGLFAFKKKKDLPFYGLLLLSVASLMASEYLVSANQKTAFFSIISRFWELGIGCLLAFGKIKDRSQKVDNLLGFVGLFLLILSLVFLKDVKFPGLMALIPCFGAALLILSAEKNKTLVAKFLSNYVLVFVGKISYSLYLWHLPLIIFYQEYSGNKVLGLSESTIFLAILLPLSIFSWKFIETPFRKNYEVSDDFKNLDLGKKIISFIRNPFFVAVVCILFVAVISTIAKKSGGLGFRLSYNALLDQEKVSEYASFSKANKCAVGKRSQPFPDIADCVVGENQKEYEVVIFGDSHAGHYASPVISWAKKRDLSVMPFYLFVCTIWMNDDLDTSDGDKCLTYRKKVWKILQEKDHIKYVFLASRWDYAIKDDEESIALFKDNLTKTINKVISLDKKLVIMGKVPDFDIKNDLSSPLKCIEKNLVPMQKIIPNHNEKCVKDSLKSLQKQLKFLQIMQDISMEYSDKNVFFFDPTDHLCDDEFCYAVKGGKLLYADQGHLNQEGAKYISERIVLENF